MSQELINHHLGKKSETADGDETPDLSNQGDDNRIGRRNSPHILSRKMSNMKSNNMRSELRSWASSQEQEGYETKEE